MTERPQKSVQQAASEDEARAKFLETACEELVHRVKSRKHGYVVFQGDQLEAITVTDTDKKVSSRGAKA